jgi:hypothetical protein
MRLHRSLEEIARARRRATTQALSPARSLCLILLQAPGQALNQTQLFFGNKLIGQSFDILKSRFAHNASS